MNPPDRPLVKLCGFTRPADVVAAVECGADLIGLVHYLPSSRHVDGDLARQLARNARHAGGNHPPKVVAVMVDPTPASVTDALDYCDLVQFHGDETPEFCAGFGHPYMRAHRLRETDDAAAIDRFLKPPAWAYLVDAFSTTAHGGTGKRLSPELLDAALSRPRGFVAGGLTVDNVASVIARWHPFGVDVSSGIESAPGKKDMGMMRAFVERVRAAAQ